MRRLFLFLLVLAAPLATPLATPLAAQDFSDPVWLNAMSGSGSGGGGGGGFTYTATGLDGSSYLTRSSAFTGGATDSQYWTVSLWVKFSALSPGNWFFYGEASSSVVIRIGQLGASGWLVQANNGATWFPAPQVITTGTWYHLLCSARNGTEASCKLYVNDTDLGGTVDNSSTVSTFSTMDSTHVGYGGGDKLFGSLSEVWFAVGSANWLDLTFSGNRAKFSLGGHPVSLGTDGSTPTGNVPMIYLHNPFGTFQNNNSGNGDFTVTGSLTDDASIP